MKKFTKKNKRAIELTIIILITILSIIFWNRFVIFPIKTFVVLMHEIFPGIAAILSGGKVINIVVNTNLGGECITDGGIPIFIASSGYLGSLLVGSSLFISAYKYKFSLWICTILSILILLFTANFFNGAFGIATAIAFAIILYISPRYFNKTIHSYLMKILGLISSLYVLIDIKEDLITLTYRPTDAQILSELTGINALFWGVLWLIISLVVVYFLFKESYEKGL